MCPGNRKRGVVYGPLVIAYLFVGGTAAGTLFAMSAWSFALRRTEHDARQREAFAILRTRAYAVGFVLLGSAMVLLFWDLERPERALLLFFKPHATAITFGSYALLLELMLAAVLFAAHAFGKPVLRGRALGILEIACCIGAVAVMAYTGVFLTRHAIPFWDTWTLVGLFVCSSLSTGYSVMLLIDWLTQGRSPLLHAAKPLQKCHLACLAAEAAFVALFVHAAFANSLAQPSVEVLLSPDLLPTAALGVAGMGIAIPAALEAYSLVKHPCRAIPVSDALCLFGGLTLRYCVIACGIH